MSGEKVIHSFNNISVALQQTLYKKKTETTTNQINYFGNNFSCRCAPRPFIEKNKTELEEKRNSNPVILHARLRFTTKLTIKRLTIHSYFQKPEINYFVTPTKPLFRFSFISPSFSLKQTATHEILFLFMVFGSNLKC